MLLYSFFFTLFIIGFIIRFSTITFITDRRIDRMSAIQMLFSSKYGPKIQSTNFSINKLNKSAYDTAVELAEGKLNNIPYPTKPVKNIFNGYSKNETK